MPRGASRPGPWLITRCRPEASPSPCWTLARFCNKDAHVASAALILARSAEAGVDKVFLVTADLQDLSPAALAIQIIASSGEPAHTTGGAFKDVHL